MKILNTYARLVASPELVNGKGRASWSGPYNEGRHLTLLAVLTAGSVGDRAVYLGIVTLPEPVNPGYEAARDNAAIWIAHNGTKINAKEAESYFDIDPKTYRA